LESSCTTHCIERWLRREEQRGSLQAELESQRKLAAQKEEERQHALTQVLALLLSPGM
jgi:hypothetical protein